MEISSERRIPDAHTVGKQYVLGPCEQHVKCDQRRDDKPGLHVLNAETGLEVKEHGAAVRRDVDHGELVRQLCLILQGCVEDETTQSDQSESLQSKWHQYGNERTKPLSRTVHPARYRGGSRASFTRCAPYHAKASVTRLEKVFAVSAIYRENW